MSVAPVIRMPGESNEVMLRGHPMVFLVTGENTKHTSMFDWTIPTGFATGLHVHRVQEETFYVLEGECVWHVGDKKIRATPAPTCSFHRAFRTTSPMSATSRRGC